MKIALAVLLIATTAGFTACINGTVNPSQQQDIAYACASIAAAEDVLAVANNAGKLSAAQHDAVAQAIKIKQPVCNVKPEPTSLTDAGYKALMGAATTFISAKATVQK